jgi:predicted enzyme related to lactoylglutathione lyase
MVQTKSIFFIGLCMFSSFSCKNDGQHNKSLNQKNMEKAYNPVVYFEIPVKDMDRAIKFYKEIIDHNEMALFPFSDESKGISGALAKGEIYKPTQNGVVIYFRTTDIDKTLELVVTSGGEILYPKTSNGDLGFVAEFKDSEGNRIALHQGL